MSSRRLRAICSMLPIFALAGCGSVNKPIGQEDPYLGEAVRYNAAVQTINPDPVYPAGSAQPGDNGEKGADAVKRYRSDEVNARHQSEAQQMSTQSISGTSGSGPR